MFIGGDGHLPSGDMTKSKTILKTFAFCFYEVWQSLVSCTYILDIGLSKARHFDRSSASHGIYIVFVIRIWVVSINVTIDYYYTDLKF